MALIPIAYGSKASSAELNANFNFLLSEIQALAAVVENNSSSASSNLSSALANYENLVYPIGSPKISFSDILQDGEIWLEGAIVSRTTYAALFAIYGTTYGAGDGETTFQLPDCRNRTFWGAANYGYIEAGLPNVTGTLTFGGYGSLTGTGAFKTRSGSTSYNASPNSTSSGKQTIDFGLSRSNAIFGSSETVQPPSIKIRVKTRYR